MAWTWNWKDRCSKVHPQLLSNFYTSTRSKSILYAYTYIEYTYKSTAIAVRQHYNSAYALEGPVLEREHYSPWIVETRREKKKKTTHEFVSLRACLPVNQSASSPSSRRRVFEVCGKGKRRRKSVWTFHLFRGEPSEKNNDSIRK